MANLSEQEIAKLKRQFLALDADGNGEISADELKGIFKDPRLKMSEKEVDLLLQDFDADGSGAIDIREFLMIMSNRNKKEIHELIHKAVVIRSAIRKSFKEFDQDGDGYITRKEFKTVMRRQKKSVTEAQLNAMVKDADRNGDEKIDYDEFLLAFTK